MGNVNVTNRFRNNKNTEAEYTFVPFKYKKLTPLKTPGYKVPFPRSGHRIVCDSKYLYSFGGYNPLRRLSNEGAGALPLFQEMWKYNYAAQKWIKFDNSKSLPMELASNAAVRLNNFLLVYGGTAIPFGDRCSNQLYMSSLTGANNKMKMIETTGQLPLPQYGQALVLHNDCLYTIGGTTGFVYTCDIHRLNLNTREWEIVFICKGQANYEPEGRYRHEVAFDGRYIYVIGGGTADKSFDLDEIPVFDTETNTWSKKKTIGDASLPFYNCTPYHRKCHGTVQVEINGDINVFIVGGEKEGQILSDMWQLNLRTLQWSKIKDFELKYPTYFHSCSVTPEGKMYLFGGILRMRELERSNDIISTWLCIPKLSEICWEALLYYYPQLVNCSKETLVKHGIPRKFVHRIE